MELVSAVTDPEGCGDSRDVFEGHAEYRGDVLVNLGWLGEAQLWEELLLLLSEYCRGRDVVRIVAPSAHSVVEFAV